MKNVTMKEKNISCKIAAYTYQELEDNDRLLIDKAKDATQYSYAPYSHFYVGAALQLRNKEIITGSNQENASFPSGLCAERTVLFYAHSQYPKEPVLTLAIAGRNEEGFTRKPISPCGACRQVMIEIINSQKQSFRILLYGQEEIYLIEDAGELLPYSFTL